MQVVLNLADEAEPTFSAFCVQNISETAVPVRVASAGAGLLQGVASRMQQLYAVPVVARRRHFNLPNTSVDAEHFAKRAGFWQRRRLLSDVKGSLAGAQTTFGPRRYKAV